MIKNMVALQVSADIAEEIQRLSVVMDKFERAFVDDPVDIKEFKRVRASNLSMPFLKAPYET